MGQCEASVAVRLHVVLACAGDGSAFWAHSMAEAEGRDAGSEVCREITVFPRGKRSVDFS